MGLTERGSLNREIKTVFLHVIPVTFFFIAQLVEIHGVTATVDGS